MQLHDQEDLEFLSKHVVWIGYSAKALTIVEYSRAVSIFQSHLALCHQNIVIFRDSNDPAVKPMAASVTPVVQITTRLLDLVAPGANSVQLRTRLTQQINRTGGWL